VALALVALYWLLGLFYTPEGKGQNNIALAALMQLGDPKACVDLLIKTDRIPEAALFARTYAPRQVFNVFSVASSPSGRFLPIAIFIFGLLMRMDGCGGACRIRPRISEIGIAGAAESSCPLRISSGQLNADRSAGFVSRTPVACHVWNFRFHFGHRCLVAFDSPNPEPSRSHLCHDSFFSFSSCQ
jgi:hypothetical protein